MTTPTPAVPVTHVYFLLDRSGSMASIADDVINGFNRFLADQQADGEDAVMTLVQFDSYEPFELLSDACPIREVLPLDAATFGPRDSTPLLDSLGKLIGRAVARASEREKTGEPTEDVVVAIFTDGEENCSTEFTRQQVLDLVETQQTTRGWAFAYLGANQDAFAEASSIGIGATSSHQFYSHGASIAESLAATSGRLMGRRMRTRSGQPHSGGFFEDGEEGEDGEVDEGGDGPVGD